ncbi:dTDP-4-dehydrorhamnose 3,5-epimerase [Roseateles sp.]|uniref:dTDP-4-dehydrorhamnose 3,5-epimerase n=1 Tax=Roseateles sp. TaxID=1971397 RepID=UPI0025EB22B0|nr:dTDP-4-dehydrorhamnose 3,5-epimerase [Roseateles sp.]MBV8034999.1 dTDP-4-dehydrorhamnose 3,5-epimerase [Roseateles sp.]
MKLHPTPLPGLWQISTEPRGDARGRLTRLHCERELAAIRPQLHFVQTNLSYTAQRGTVRGLHFQRAPALEAKLIRCLRGRVFDVAVDLRAGSASFGRWFGLELAADNEQQVFIPEGFAHGFQALTNDVELLYQHTAAYAPRHEGGLRPDDPALAIDWPLPIGQLSDRDRSHPALDAAFAPLQA